MVSKKDNKIPTPPHQTEEFKLARIAAEEGVKNHNDSKQLAQACSEHAQACYNVLYANIPVGNCMAPYCLAPLLTTTARDGGVTKPEKWNEVITLISVSVSMTQEWKDAMEKICDEGRTAASAWVQLTSQ